MNLARCVYLARFSDEQFWIIYLEKKEIIMHFLILLFVALCVKHN